MYLYNNPNSYRDVAHIQQLDAVGAQVQPQESPNNVIVENYNSTIHTTRIIGIKNVTKQSGATTLAYMLKNQLKQHYSVVAIEVNKSDFKYFNDKTLVSTKATEIGNTIAKYSDKDVIIVDVNDSSQAEGLCTDMLYLIEPSMIKLNKLMFIDRAGNFLKALRNKKVILNQSLLNQKDVLDFEYEAGLKIFYNMPPLDEREKSIHALNKFLVMLGFGKQSDTEEEEKKNKMLGLFGL